VGETYNVGGLNEMSNIDVVSTICQIMDELHPSGRPHHQLITYVKDRPGHDRRYAINCSKLQRELAWQPRESFATGIRKTVAWYLEHLDWAEAITSGAYRQWMDLNYSAREAM
jgi:dTDP-glucose 4,6-dehydratase